jgi:hypothetical protein
MESLVCAGKSRSRVITHSLCALAEKAFDFFAYASALKNNRERTTHRAPKPCCRTEAHFLQGRAMQNSTEPNGSSNVN